MRTNASGVETNLAESAQDASVTFTKAETVGGGSKTAAMQENSEEVVRLEDFLSDTAGLLLKNFDIASQTGSPQAPQMITSTQYAILDSPDMQEPVGSKKTHWLPKSTISAPRDDTPPPQKGAPHQQQFSNNATYYQIGSPADDIVDAAPLHPRSGSGELGGAQSGSDSSGSESRGGVTAFYAENDAAWLFPPSLQKPQGIATVDNHHQRHHPGGEEHERSLGEAEARISMEEAELEEEGELSNSVFSEELSQNLSGFSCHLDESGLVLQGSHRGTNRNSLDVSLHLEHYYPNKEPAEKKAATGGKKDREMSSPVDDSSLNLEDDCMYDERCVALTVKHGL